MASLLAPRNGVGPLPPFVERTSTPTFHQSTHFQGCAVGTALGSPCSPADHPLVHGLLKAVPTTRHTMGCHVNSDKALYCCAREVSTGSVKPLLFINGCQDGVEQPTFPCFRADDESPSLFLSFLQVTLKFCCCTICREGFVNHH